MFISVLQAIGNTPIVRVSHAPESGAAIWLKLENRNPGGSIKDRVARYCVEAAVARGELAPGGTIVAATSGNMGIGLAMVGAAKKLKCVLTMPESMSVERRALLAGYGAELVLTPASGGMAEAVKKAAEIAARRDAWLLDQFSNPDMAACHYETTGPEIYSQSGGAMDVVVDGVGSGSTITGVGRYLKEQNGRVRVVAVEPAESPVLSGGKPGPHGIQGIGAGFVPDVLDRSLIDEVITIETGQAIDQARSLMAMHGICAGISTGANLAAAHILAARPEMAGLNIVTFACDTGERYLSTPLFRGN